MALRKLRGRRRGGSGTASIALMGAGGVLAGTALAWLFSPSRGAERRERAGSVLRGASERVRAEARTVSTRASEALHDARERVEAEARAAAAEPGKLPARAREAAEAVRARADQGRAALEARGWSPRQTALGIAGGALIGRAVLGRGLLRIPAGLLGASLLVRAASQSEGVRKGLRRTGEAAHEAAERLRVARESAGAGGASGEPRATSASSPEVREVKSPAELEEGIATGRPEPTYPGRADRSGPHMGGPAGSDRPRRAAEPDDEGVLSAPSTDDVRREGGFDAPTPGASVREGDLGVVLPHEGAPPGGEETGESRVLGPDGEPITKREPGAGSERSRREPDEDVE
jgi:hypothetical protein